MTTLVDTETISASTGAGSATPPAVSQPSAPWIYSPWLDHTDGPPTPEGAASTGARAGISTLRGAFHPDAGIAGDVARQVAEVLHELDGSGRRSNAA